MSGELCGCCTTNFVAMQNCIIAAVCGSETQATCEASDPHEVLLHPASVLKTVLSTDAVNPELAQPHKCP